MVTQIKTGGRKIQLTIGIDNTVISLYKRIKSEEWNKLQHNSKAEYILANIYLTKVKKVARAIYNQKRIYIWYINKSKNTKRIDLDFQTQPIAVAVLNKCNSVVHPHYKI